MFGFRMGFSGTADLMTLFSVRTNPNGQTDDRPTVDIASNQDSTDSESIDTPQFAVTHQSNLIELISEQRNDHTLTNCMHRAKVAKGNYFFKGGAKFYPETRNILDCDQSNYSSRIILAHIPAKLLS